MKKLLFALAVSLSFQAKAQSVNLDVSFTAQPLGVASQSASIMYGVELSPNSYTANVLRQITVDSTGGLKGSTSTAQLVSLTSSYVYASATVQLVTTSGLAVNVSTVAGASCNDCRVYWSTRDAVGVYWDYSNSATIPAILGHFTATSVTATLDDGFVDGQIMHFRPTGASSVSVFVTVKKRQ